ncbi:MAG: phosphate signaling complex protein PhoU [Caldilineaceae bacterium]|nr:phosphate signaling complex protein PhoU [Caldilineaceae bacterium]
MREQFERQLNELRSDILHMGKLVEEELLLALKALDTLDKALAAQVYEADEEVNRLRFVTEEKCFTIIVTQQPAARDLRAVVSVMNMIVDLERMGDQAKGIAKVIPRLSEREERSLPPELGQMGEMVINMLRQSMVAYQNDSVGLARFVAAQDDEVDDLFSRVFGNLMQQMAQDSEPDQIKSSYEMLRVARELERFGDLATNIAERVVYRVTGQIQEINSD